MLPEFIVLWMVGNALFWSRFWRRSANNLLLGRDLVVAFLGEAEDGNTDEPEPDQGQILDLTPLLLEPRSAKSY